MPVKPLYDPANAVESAQGFKEGLIRVEQSVHKVHQPKAGEGQTSDRNPFMALAWQCTRLDEETKEPMLDGDDNPITEELIFSFGATSLAKVHPGLADSPESNDIEDAGVEINAEGPTVYMVDQAWWPNKKAGLVHLMESLKGKGLKPDQLTRVWAPDWVGCIFYMKSQQAEDKMWRPNAKKGGQLEEVAYSYKVVERIERGPRQGAVKADLKVAPKSKASAANGKQSSDAESQIKPLIEALAQEYTGKSMTKKSLIAHVTTKVAEAGLKNDMIPIVKLVQSDEWLAANGPNYDFAFIDNKVVFS